MFTEQIDGFDRDQGNTAKCQRHGLSIADIETLLLGEPRVAPDLKHGIGEQRLIAVGRNVQGRPMFVAFTIREAEGRRLIRLISARFMHAREIGRYEPQSS